MADKLNREQRLLQINTRLKNSNERLRKENGALRRDIRALQKETDVTETVTFTPVQCPYCHLSDGLGPAQDTVIKYQEDIVIVPRKIVKKYVITRHWCSHCKEYVRSDHVPLSPERI